MTTFIAQQGKRNRCICGTLRHAHDDITKECPTLYRPDTIERAEDEMRAAQASGDLVRIFLARGELQRLRGKS